MRSMSTKEIEKTVEQMRRNGTYARAKAIRFHCLDCSGGSVYEVGKCPNTKCPLWEFRLSKRVPVPTK